MSDDPSAYLRPAASKRVMDQTRAFDTKKWLWIPHDEEGFQQVEVKKSHGEKITLEFLDGSVSLQLFCCNNESNLKL